MVEKIENFLMKFQNEKLLTVCKVLNTLLLASIIFDPTNTLLHAKVPLFVLFCLISIPYISFKYLFVPLGFLAVMGVSLLFATITHEPIITVNVITILKSFLFLFYLLWMNSNTFSTFKILYKISIVLCCIEFSFALMYICARPLFDIFIPFFDNHGRFLMMGTRNYYGLTVIMIFYKTSSLLVLPLSVAIAKYFDYKEKKYLIHSAILFLGLLISGTRANILSVFLITYFNVLFYLYYYKKRKLIVLPILFISIIGIIALVGFLLIAKDTSTSIKQSLLFDYINLFKSDLLKTFTFGFSPGKEFYTSYYNNLSAGSELCYFDLIKNFGLIGTIVLVGLMIYPLYVLIKHNPLTNLFKFSFFWGYLAYLFIAGTNPLLVCSTGILAICMGYYVADKDIYKEI